MLSLLQFFFPLAPFFCGLFSWRNSALGILTVPAMYMAEGNKVWQLQGTNDWITLSHCQGIILTLNKGEKKHRRCVGVSMRVCTYVCMCVSGPALRHSSVTS